MEGVIAVRIARSVIDVIVSHAREAQPAECCGLLLGPSTPLATGAPASPRTGPGLTIAEAVPIPNLSEDPNRFFIEPEGHITARRQARDRGLAVLGFYHSHPRSSPAPSATDLLEASYPDHLYLIVSLAAPAAQIRVFRYRVGPESGGDDEDRSAGGTFVETPFTTAG